MPGEEENNIGQPDPTMDRLRLRYTFWIAFSGIAGIVVAFGVAVYAFGGKTSPSSIIVAVLGPVTGVVGTLAGYVAGTQSGAAGREQAERRADTAQKELSKALAEVQRQNRDLFASGRGGGAPPGRGEERPPPGRGDEPSG
jgi:hypothetical protein